MEQINQKVETTYYVDETRSFRFIVTPHETTGNTISIHGLQLGATIYCTVDQAVQLAKDLERAILVIEIHEGIKQKRKEKENANTDTSSN